MGRCCNLSCHIWVDLLDSSVSRVPMFAHSKPGYFFLIYFFFFLLWSIFSESICVICDLQVKIKRKQRLVKKDVEPIFSQDDLNNAPKAEGSSFSLFSTLLFIVGTLFYNFFGAYL